MKIKNVFLKITASALIGVLLFSGCSKSGKDESKTNADVPTGGQKIQKLLIGTSGSPKPYSYLNEKNELDGYDIAVLKEIDALLPEYQIEFEKTEFQSIFAGIDSGRYQVGANNITKKPEREEKYLFGNEYYYFNTTVVVVKKGRTDIKSLDDLAGKKTPVSASGGFGQLFIEQYNKEHPDKKIQGVYTDQDSAKTYQDINAGLFDFTFAEKVMIKFIEETYKIDLDYVELPREQFEKIQNPHAYFIFSKTGDGPKIRDAFDGALGTLIKNGKLKELSEKYLGGDYSR